MKWQLNPLFFVLLAALLLDAAIAYGIYFLVS